MSAADNDADDDVKLSLKVMMDKEKGKILFAVADNHFVDILLSFLTFPLGRIVKVLNEYCETPTVGSLTTLYNSLTNLDRAHFVTKRAKETLLSPASSFEDEYKRMKLDIPDFLPAVYFRCPSTYHKNRFRSVSIYYDYPTCRICGSKMKKEVDEKESEAASSSDGVFTIPKAFFTISDDLQIFSNEIGILQIISLLGITDLHNAEEIQEEFGFNEIMYLLEASLTSPTPLTDVIQNITTLMKSARIPLQETSKEENPNYINLSLKLTIQKSTGKLLYAQAKEDFVEFLFGFSLLQISTFSTVLNCRVCAFPIVETGGVEKDPHLYLRFVTVDNT